MTEIITHPIQLTTTLLATMDGETQQIDEAFTGTLKQHGDNFLLTYEDPENKGHATVKVAPNALVINRQGEVSTLLRFSLGEREHAHYQIAEGGLAIETETSDFLLEADNEGGKVEVAYTLYINGQYASDNRLTLNWTL